MDIEVLADVWGTYKKGNVIKNIPHSTALACIKTGKVKEAGTETPDSKTPKKKKKYDE